jgi:asparagine synthase (glutamine-hydrolysing)
VVHETGERKWKYWQPDLSRRLRGLSNQEYAEQFLALLDQSVRCRMRSTTPVGVLMSGGLDSTSVASLAARMIAPEPLTTISYVFDELPECDERKYINAMVERWGIHSIQIPCDDAWPYKDWRHNPNYPEVSIYRLLKERSYLQARREGKRVLLTGEYGDNLYMRGNSWLGDLIIDGKFLEACQELYLYFRYTNLRWLINTGYVQHAARVLLNSIPGGRYISRKATMPEWLTPFSIHHLPKVRSNPILEQHAGLLDLIFANSCTSEIYPASQQEIELRHPYRDRRLVEFVLNLPAYQLFYRSLYKRILRSATQGILPDIIRYRDQPTFLTPFFYRGVEQKRSDLQVQFQNTQSAWTKFVEQNWILHQSNIMQIPEQDGAYAIVPWLCASFQSWLE